MHKNLQHILCLSKNALNGALSMCVEQGITHFSADRPMVMAVGGRQRQMDCVCLHATVSVCSYVCMHARVFVSRCAFVNTSVSVCVPQHICCRNSAVGLAAYSLHEEGSSAAWLMLQ